MLATCFNPTIPKITASIAGITIMNAGRLMIPSTSDATQNPLFVPVASSVVPSIVNGMPQLLQLFAVIVLLAMHRGQMMICFPSFVR